MRTVGVVFIGGELDGKQALLPEHNCHSFRHAILSAISEYPPEEQYPSTQRFPSETYTGRPFFVENQYVLMVKKEITTEQAWLRILDYYIEHAEAVKLKAEHEAE